MVIGVRRRRVVAARARLPGDRPRCRPRTTRSSARSWSRRRTTCCGSWSTCSSSTASATVHDTGAASFLYPFLGERETDDEAVLEDVRRSILMKAEEIGALRDADAHRGPRDADRRGGRRCAAAGRLLALGNGGSATDAMDLVADLERAGRPAIDLTEDPAILTAIANDVGVEAIFARQVIAHGRAGDVLLSLSTSGGSANVISALAEARRRGLVHDRAGRLRRRPDRGRGARRPRGDHALAAHPADPGGAGERLPRPLRAGGRPSERDHPRELRGIVGAMAMTGLRVFALHAGLIREDPPSRLTRKKAHGLLKRAAQAAAGGRRARALGDGRRVRHRLRRCCPSGSGASAGRARCTASSSGWASTPCVAPALGLTERNWPKGRERAVFVADHVLFGLVLSELRRAPTGMTASIQRVRIRVEGVVQGVGFRPVRAPARGRARARRLRAQRRARRGDRGRGARRRRSRRCSRGCRPRRRRWPWSSA